MHRLMCCWLDFSEPLPRPVRCLLHSGCIVFSLMQQHQYYYAARLHFQSKVVLKYCKIYILFYWIILTLSTLLCNKFRVNLVRRQACPNWGVRGSEHWGMSLCHGCYVIRLFDTLKMLNRQAFLLLPTLKKKKRNKLAQVRSGPLDSECLTQALEAAGGRRWLLKG